MKSIKSKSLVICLALFAILMACRGKTSPIQDEFCVEEIKESTPVFTSGSAVIGTAVRMMDEMTMIYIPAGRFEMGLEDGNDDVQPAHKVFLDSYWIDRTEVTNGQYQKCVADGTCTLPLFTDNVITKILFNKNNTRLRDSYFDNNVFIDYPVVYVDSKQAQTYCRWVGGRLPTEAEWEKAARGMDGRKYPWGDTFFGDRLNYCDKNSDCRWPESEWREWDDGYAEHAPVGSYPDGASPFGVLDMAGNVYEWVADWYDYDYYSTSPKENPTGPACGEFRVLRGGSWGNQMWEINVYNRTESKPGYQSHGVGFRCASSSGTN